MLLHLSFYPLISIISHRGNDTAQKEMKITTYTIFITILFSLNSSNCWPQKNIDSIYNSLPLRNRLKLLFADTLQQHLVLEQPMNTNCVVRDMGRFNHPKNGNGFSLLLDATQPLNNQGRYPTPSIQSIRDIRDSALMAGYYAHLVALYRNKGVHGIYTKTEDKAYALYINPNNKHELVPFMIRPFPDRLNRQNNIPPNPNPTRQQTTNRGNSCDESLESLLESRHLFFSNNMDQHIGMMLRAIEQKMIDQSLFDRRIKEIIALQHQPATTLGKHHRSSDYWNYELYKKSMVCFSRHFEPIVDFSNTEIGYYDNLTARENNLPVLLKRYTENVVKAHPSVLANAAFMKYYVVAAKSSQEVREAAMAIKEVNRAFDNQIILLYQGSWQDKIFKDTLVQQFHTLLVSQGPDDLMVDLQTQALLGGIGVDRFPITPDGLESAGYQPLALQKSRLAYAPAENAGMNDTALEHIGAIMGEMVKQKAAPGGQVLVARRGAVVYRKSFGKESYSKGLPVDDESIYDLASVTKVMGTTPLMMILYDDSTLTNQTRLEEILPTARNTNKAEITIQDLLLHQAGLPAFIPFYQHALDSAKINKPIYSNRLSKEYPIRVDTRLFMMANPPYRETVFRAQRDSLFNVRVSENLFMNHRFKDEMIRKIYSEPLRKRDYRYSDLSFYLAQQIIEHRYGKAENQVYDQLFSQPLGAKRLTFNPLEKFKPEEIIPTENDLAFRKELLRGYVHDPGAAMMGGVAGHAGLFANSNDLAKMAQMLLNKGVYGGKQYISPQTVELFTRQQVDGNRRGLGFDKPEPDKSKSGPCSDLASPASYGHSGFTGTFIWIDPDKDLIYIFLSNRVHPYAYNKKLIDMGFRKRVQDAVYRAIQE